MDLLHKWFSALFEDIENGRIGKKSDSVRGGIGSFKSCIAFIQTDQTKNFTAVQLIIESQSSLFLELEIKKSASLLKVNRLLMEKSTCSGTITVTKSERLTVRLDKMSQCWLLGFN